MQHRQVTVLAGGVGGARFLSGVLEVVPPAAVTVVGNVGDDLEVYGLHVSPDLDTVLYTLTGWSDEERGWGVRGDTPRALERARSLGAEAWFWLGDLDLGLHLARTEGLLRGEPLSAVTQRLAGALGLEARLLPATDDRLRTLLRTPDGELEFQDYYVRRGHSDTVLGVRFEGADEASPAPGVVDAVTAAEALLIAPSNPLISVDPILAVQGIRDAVAARTGGRVAVSPIVAGAALRGPAADMLRSTGRDASPVGIARHYRGLIDTLVLDTADARLAADVERLGIRAVVCDTVMRDAATRRGLAQAALDAAGAGVP